MPCSPLYAFHRKTIVLADDCHPFERHDQPKEDNSSLPWIQCLVAQLFLIPLYCIPIQSICRWLKRSRVLSWCFYSVHTRGTSKHIEHDLYFEFDAMLRPNTFSKTWKDSRSFFNAQRDLVVKTTSLSKRPAKIYKRVYHV